MSTAFRWILEVAVSASPQLARSYAQATTVVCLELLGSQISSPLPLLLG